MVENRNWGLAGFFWKPPFNIEPYRTQLNVRLPRPVRDVRNHVHRLDGKIHISNMEYEHENISHRIHVWYIC
jgi:hypothetical protein